MLNMPLAWIGTMTWTLGWFLIPLVITEILPRIGPAKQHGITWHYSRPPIVSIE